ncbi:MAG: serine/threonine protein kinase [Planctomycetaceae bacterium]|nr:serine/threonine protein kinase [Planctomycetaceae bacterium]
MSIKSADDDNEKNQLTRESAQDLVEEIIRKYGREISALEALEEHDGLRQYRSCVVDLAYEEYAVARERGIEIPATEFVQRFTGVEQSLYRMLEFDQLLRENPSLVEPVPEERWPRKGQVFQNFELLSDVGRGALSRVFLARHTQLGDKAVIVKVCIRGEQEAGLLGSLAHPVIGEVHSITPDTTTGLSVICMPYQTRCTIHDVTEWMENEHREHGVMPTPEQVSQHVRDETQIDVDGMDAEAFRGLATGYFADDDFDQLVAKWGVDLCSALQHAHQKGVLHCDVKPGNILVLPDLSVRLLDFNLATRREDQARMAGGTPPFMAPEQLRLMMQMADSPRTDEPDTTPQVVVEEQADVFGLSATLWHLITGKPPFGTTADFRTPADAALAMLTRHSVGVGSNLVREARKRVPAALVEVLLQGMSTDRDVRFQSMAELREALSQCIRKRRERSYWTIAAASITLAAAIGAAAFVYINPVNNAVNSAQKSYVAGRFDDAREQLREFRGDSPFTQVWNLAIYTAQSPLMVNHKLPNSYSRGQNRAKYRGYEVAPTDELTEHWKQLADEWERLARESPYEMECWYNAYLCHLEISNFGDDPFGFAKQAFAAALSRGLDKNVCPYDVMLLQLSEVRTSEEFDLESLRAIVRHSSHLSRGQFRLLDYVFGQAVEAAESDSQMAADLRDMQAELIPLLESDRRPVAPSDVSEILGSLDDIETRLRIQQKWTQGKTPRSKHRIEMPAKNRLNRILILPDRAIGDVWSEGRHIGRNVADSLNVLRLEALCQTETPGQEI